MKRIIVIFSVMLLIANFQVSAQDAREISKKAMDAIEVTDMEMISTINIHDGKGNVRVRQISTASRRFSDCSKMIIKFLAPADVKGTTLLVYDYENQEDSQWIYMPALRKVRRIVSTEKSKNFMGSEFTNADMSKPNLNDYNYTLLKEDVFEGKKCWVIEAKAKDDKVRQENGFAKRVSYIDKETNFCYKIEYYDASDNQQREQLISDYRKQSNGKNFAHKMVMQNVQNGRKSEMIVDKFQLGSKLPEATFSPSAIEN